MDLSISKKRSALALGGLLAMTVCAGTTQAANLLAITQGVSPTLVTSVAVSCNTANGTGANQTIIIKPVTALTGSNTITVTYTLPSPNGGIVVTAPVSGVLSTTTTSLSYTINIAAGCVGAVNGSKTIQFLAAANAGSAANDATLAVVDTLTVATNSGLVAAPVTITCTRTSGPTYTPGPAQTISVTSAANGGIPFTVASGYASWLTLSSTSGGTANSTPVKFTAVTTSPCGSFNVGTSNSTTLHLVSTGAGSGSADLLVPVTLLVVSPTPLTVTPVPAAPSISLSYLKGSGTPAVANVSVSSSVPSAFFTVNTSSLPIWLTVNSTSGIATAPLAFSTTGVADTLAPGTYSATIYLKVSGYADLPVPITLLVTNKAPKLTVSSTSIPVTWTIGTAAPTVNITAFSSDSPISYTTTTGGTLAPIVGANQQAGLAYSFGTTIPITFNSLVFATAQPGTVLTGTVTFSWGSPVSTTVVTISMTVVSPGATLSSISPATLPTALPGTSFTVTLTGTGFVGGTDPTLKTKVGTVAGGLIAADTNFSVNVVNASNIILTITVPGTADPLLPFAPAGVNGVVGGSVFLGLCNGICTSPTGTATLTIGGGPIIQGVTSSSSFVEVTAPAMPTVAPYDMISLFGSNFCASAGTGCSSTQLLSGSPDPLTLRYPTTLSPDTPSATQRLVSVSFLAHGTTTVIGTAPLLFATNNQINVIVPAAVSGSIGAGNVDIVANFGYGSGATMLKSNPFQVNVAATDPGVFTVGSNGQGAGAALDTSWALISNSNPAGMRTGAHTPADSDTIQLYVTGLGIPDSTGDNTSAGAGSVPGDCIAASSGTGNYMSTLQGATSVSPSLTNIDGAVMQSSLLSAGRIVPCLTSMPTVKIGGVSSTVSYAGFVADTVGGLYQINVKLPPSTGSTLYPFYPLTTSPISTITAPVQLPVQVTVGGQVSQNNVTVWVAPRLLVTGPTGSALNATVGIPWSGTVTAFEGTGAYRYAVTSGVLPSGLTLAPTTGVISGTPNANTAGSYGVTITATDSANIPVTGKYSMVIVVAGGLYVSFTGSSPYNFTSPGFGSAGTTLTTVTATGGTYGANGYTYAITTPAAVPVGMAVSGPGASGAVTTTAATPSGTYDVVVTATDSASTPLTGTASFSIIVPLGMSNTAPASGVTHGTSSVVTTVTASGGSGTILYTLDSTSVTNGFTVDASGNVSPTNVTGAGSFTITVTATDSVTLAPGATSFGTGSTSPISVTLI